MTLIYSLNYIVWVYPKKFVYDAGSQVYPNFNYDIVIGHSNERDKKH